MKTSFILSLFLCLAISSIAQQDSIPRPPYQRFPTVPPFRLLLTDSVSYYSKADLPKKKTTMMMVFSPDCEHCQHETEAIIQNIAEFKSVQIIMASLVPFEKIKAFNDKYQLSRFDNIIIGKDANYMLPDFYRVHNLPFLAFYNKKKELISVFEGSLAIPRMLEELAK